MGENDYFDDSVPDGISNGIYSYDDSIDCSNQDSYELLVKTFGLDVCGNDLKAATREDCIKFAEAMKTNFKLSRAPSAEDAESIIKHALNQWVVRKSSPGNV